MSADNGIDAKVRDSGKHDKKLAAGSDLAGSDPARLDPGLRKRLDRIAWLMDSSIRLPGGFRIGLDGLIGLIPGIGDATGAVISTYIVAQGIKAGVPKRVLLRMAANIALELGIGSIPILGDVFDFIFRANEKNVGLMEQYLASPESTKNRSTFWIAGVLLTLVGTLIIIAWIAFRILAALWHLIT